MEDKEHRIQLYIGNINFRTTERELMEEFSECGKILGVKIPTRNGASCGYGFITIGDKETADKIIQRFDGAELQGRKIYIKSAGRRPKAPNYKDENERYEHRNDDYCYRVERERPLYDERFMREIYNATIDIDKEKITQEIDSMKRRECGALEEDELKNGVMFIRFGSVT